jgi:replicative superfamily II helicase
VPGCMKPLLSLLCAALLVSCSMLPFGGKKESSVPEWLRKSDASRVVVLPFENLTAEPDLEKMVRQSFYSHFAPKNYRDIEINEVDRSLEILRKSYSKSWQDVSPQELGSLFQADFLIYGKVLQYTKIFAAVYSQVAIKVQVEMVKCSDGKGVWEKTAE